MPEDPGRSGAEGLVVVVVVAVAATAVAARISTMETNIFFSLACGGGRAGRNLLVLQR